MKSETQLSLVVIAFLVYLVGGLIWAVHTQPIVNYGVVTPCTNQIPPNNIGT